MMVMPTAAFAALIQIGMLFRKAQFARFALGSATCRNPFFPLQRRTASGSFELKYSVGANWFLSVGLRFLVEVYMA